jgi:hypothetical protein
MTDTGTEAAADADPVTAACAIAVQPSWPSWRGHSPSLSPRSSVTRGEQRGVAVLFAPVSVRRLWRRRVAADRISRHGLD